jgi:hypothetical protein
VKALIAAVLAVLVVTPLAISRPATPEKRPPSVFYGHIKSMKATKGGYEIRFDPAWWLTGRAAEQAKFEDTGSRDVPNDYYIVEEGHRLLTFPVGKQAEVTMIGTNVRTIHLSTAELNQLENGRNPRHRHLMEPTAGFWIQVGEKYPNRAVKLIQQYQP